MIIFSMAVTMKAVVFIMIRMKVVMIKMMAIMLFKVFSQ